MPAPNNVTRHVCTSELIFCGIGLYSSFFDTFGIVVICTCLVAQLQLIEVTLDSFLSFVPKELGGT